MDANLITALVTLTVALIAASPGLVALYQNRNKVRTEAGSLNADTAAKYQKFRRQFY